MPERLNWFALLLDRYFGGVADKILALVHVQPADSLHPIPPYLASSMAVFIVAAIFFLWLRTRISVERPGATQQVVEALITNPIGVGIKDLLEDSAGHGAERYVPMVGSVAIFILLGNAISLFPALESPTSSGRVTLACAIVTFLYYNWVGLRHHGPLHYAGTFAGPVKALAVLMFPVEILSHSARLLSLSVRLWANMFASELLYVIFLGLAMLPGQQVGHWNPVAGFLLGIFPATIPVLFLLLHAFVAVMQAFVFTILPAIYIGMAVADEH
jgi:F-type H+-transporting ATPase subunit a